MEVILGVKSIADEGMPPHYGKLDYFFYLIKCLIIMEKRYLCVSKYNLLGFL